MLLTEAPNMSLPRLAYLGPVGTYSHQAASDKFGGLVHYYAAKTIAGVFAAVSKQIPFAVIPQENSIFGIVTETYDLLRSPDVGRTKFVRGEITLRVQHCLLVRDRVKLEDITKVLSHEQALGQCRRFLAQRMPDIPVEKATSTAAAARALLLPENGTCAAICSKQCAAVYPGLDVLYEGIEDTREGAPDNLTRFYILATDLHVYLPTLSEARVSQRRALIRVSLGQNSESAFPQGARFPCIVWWIAALGLIPTRIDRRPSCTAAEPFLDVYFVEVQDDYLEDAGEEIWEVDVRHALDRAKENVGGDAVLLGAWGVYDTPAARL